MNIKMFGQVKEIFDELTGKNRFTKGDFVVLKTMMMLAAVDGVISPEEIDRFKTLAEQCRGYNGKSFDALWDAAVRSAGYLLLQSHFLDRDSLAEAFAGEAMKDFVGELVQEERAIRARAFDRLEKMALADGECSPVERACIDALARCVKEARDAAIAARYPRAQLF